MGGRMKKQAQALLGKLPALLERWKYPLLIFLAGLVLLLWPGGSGGQKQPRRTARKGHHHGRRTPLLQARVPEPPR